MYRNALLECIVGMVVMTTLSRTLWLNNWIFFALFQISAFVCMSSIRYDSDVRSSSRKLKTEENVYLQHSDLEGDDEDTEIDMMEMNEGHVV